MAFGACATQSAVHGSGGLAQVNKSNTVPYLLLVRLDLAYLGGSLVGTPNCWIHSHSLR
jgi:hypothetical protein